MTPTDLGYVLYKVKDLGAAVDDFRNRGFAVEYGRRRNPINALAYFGEGPYLELLARTGTPKALKKLTALVGGRHWRALSRLAGWDECAEGLCGLCLEGDDAQFRYAVRSLDDDGLELGPHRTDTAGRTLRYRVFFPAAPDLPFFHDALLHRPAPDGLHPPGRGAPHHLGAPAGAAGQAPARPRPVRGQGPCPGAARHGDARGLRRRHCPGGG